MQFFYNYLIKLKLDNNRLGIRGKIMILLNTKHQKHTNMKQLFIFFILVMGLGYLSLHAQSGKLENDSKTKVVIVKEKIESKSYVIHCDRIYPMRGQSRYITNDYSIELKGDTVRSYLPYFGVAHSASYGGNNVLDFKKVCRDYVIKEGKKGSWVVSFTVENENETLEYQLTIYPNGNVRVFIQPMKRDSVSYSGELELE